MAEDTSRETAPQHPEVHDVTPPYLTPRSINSLTSLRFFAAMYVLFLHSGSHYLEVRVPGIGPYLASFLANGYLGVSLFFVLSGFILNYIYENSVNSAKMLSTYSVARFARVYPVYILSLLLAGITINLSPQLDIGPRWPQFLLLHSWPPLGADLQVALWNPPAWTLSVELAFYILFPLAIPRINALNIRYIFLAGLSLGCLIVAFRTPSIGARPPLNAWMNYVPLPLWRMPEFILGCLTANLFRKRIVSNSFASILVIFSITGLLITLASSKSPWVAGIAAIWFALLIYSCASSTDGKIYRFLNNRYLVYMGAASYAIYIFQSPVRALLETYISPYSGLLARLIYYPCLLSFSAGVYFFYEEPVRRLIRRILSARK